MHGETGLGRTARFSGEGTTATRAIARALPGSSLALAERVQPGTQTPKGPKYPNLRYTGFPYSESELCFWVDALWSGTWTLRVHDILWHERALHKCTRGAMIYDMEEQGSSKSRGRTYICNNRPVGKLSRRNPCFSRSTPLTPNCNGPLSPIIPVGPCNIMLEASCAGSMFHALRSNIRLSDAVPRSLKILLLRASWSLLFAGCWSFLEGSWVVLVSSFAQVRTQESSKKQELWTLFHGRPLIEERGKYVCR